MNEEPNNDWTVVEKQRRVFAEPVADSSDKKLRFRYTEKSQVVEDYLTEFQAGQKNIDENLELFYPYELPQSERESFNESDKAERLYGILIGKESSHAQRLKALDWLLAYDCQPAVDWFHEQFQSDPGKYMGYRRVPSDYRMHKLLAANETSLTAIENEIRKRVDSKGDGWMYTQLMQKVAPERFLDFCQAEMDRSPRRYYANLLATNRPSIQLVDAIRSALKQVPEDDWSGPIATLLENESTRNAALELVDQCEPAEPTLGWWRTIGMYGNKSHREKALKALEDFELDNALCEAVYDIDHVAGLAMFDQLLVTLDTNRRRSFAQFTYYSYECYYGNKIDDNQLEFIKWVIRIGLESYAMEALCEAWRGSEGDEKAVQDLGPTLLETLRNPERKFLLTAVDALGQLFRATQNQEVIDAIVASEKVHFSESEPGETALEHYARNLQLIGGANAVAAAASFWSRIDETRLLKESFTRWFDQQWCKNGLSIEGLLEELKSQGHAIKETEEDLYMNAWSEFNDRRQSAPSLCVFPQGYYESVIGALESTSFGCITHDDFEYVLEALQNLSETEFSFDALQNSSGKATFVTNKRLVHFDASCCDVAKVVDLANELLAINSSGVLQKRFVLLPMSEDNQHCLLYDTTERLQALTSKFFLLHPEDRQLEPR